MRQTGARSRLRETGQREEHKDGQLEEAEAAVGASGHQSPLSAAYRTSRLLVLYRRPVLGERRATTLQLSTQAAGCQHWATGCQH